MYSLSKRSIYIILTILIIMSCSDTNQAQKRNDKKNIVEKQQVISLVKKIVKEYKADISWFKKADGASFTFDIQKAILDNERQPKLITGILKDVWQNDKDIYILIEDYISLTTIFYVLKLDNEQMNKILSEKENQYAQVACIANILTADKPLLTYKSESDNNSLESMFIADADVLIVRGECFMILKVNNLAYSDLLSE